MAYLNKKQYEFRANSAARRSFENGEKAVQAGMSEEQTELVIRLCSLRHEFHSNLDAVVKHGPDENSDILNRLQQLDDDMLEAGMDRVASLSDIIMMPYVFEYQDVPEPEFEPPHFDNGDYSEVDKDSEEYREWYDSTYFEIYNRYNAVNSEIESYLAGIDEKYGTNFCPTGALRVF